MGIFAMLRMLSCPRGHRFDLARSVEVHLVEGRVPVGQTMARNDLQALDQGRGVRPAVRFHMF